MSYNLTFGFSSDSFKSADDFFDLAFIFILRFRFGYNADFFIGFDNDNDNDI